MCVLRVGGCGRDSQHDGARTRMMQTKRKKMTKKKQAFNVAYLQVLMAKLMPVGLFPSYAILQWEKGVP